MSCSTYVLSTVVCVHCSNPPPSLPRLQFAARFTGYVDLPVAGSWTFYSSSDDGSRVWIGDQLVVDNDGLHGMEEKSGIYTAARAGIHRIKVTFFERSGGAGLILSFKPPEGADPTKVRVLYVYDHTRIQRVFSVYIQCTDARRR